MILISNRLECNSSEREQRTDRGRLAGKKKEPITMDRLFATASGVVPQRRLERLAFSSAGRRSNPLSYWGISTDGKIVAQSRRRAKFGQPVDLGQNPRPASAGAVTRARRKFDNRSYLCNNYT